MENKDWCKPQNKKHKHKKPNKAKTIKDSFRQYKKNIKKESEFNVDYKTYRGICESFNKMISETILLKATELKVPYRLGNIRIKKKKMNFKPENRKYLKVDWKRTNETGVRVYHLNDHTDGFNHRWYWEKSKAIVKNKKKYYFQATRHNKRRLAHLLKDEHSTVDYFE